MKVLGVAGKSGSGKTTLIERLIPQLKARGQRVSVIKHAHTRFDIDHPGKDSWRHREAGAFEVLIASAHRLAKMREYEVQGHPTVHQLIAELVDCDWVLVEGFKHADIHKIELVRAVQSEPPVYPDDPFTIAIVAEDPARLPEPTQRPVFARDAVTELADYLMTQAERCAYDPTLYG